MGLTLEQARELREQALQNKKKERKVRVDAIVTKSLSLEEVEKKLRNLIITNPERSVFGLVVLDRVTNDWDSPDRDKIRAEVKAELIDKYGQVFFGCEISEYNVGNNSIAFHFTMKM